MIEWLNNPILAVDNDQWPRLIFFIVLAVFWVVGKLVKTGQEKSAKKTTLPSQRTTLPRSEPQEIPSQPQSQRQVETVEADDGNSPREEYERDVAAARERFDEVLEKVRAYKDKIDQMDVDEAQRKQILLKVEQARAVAYREFESARAAAKQKMDARLQGGEVPRPVQPRPQVHRPAESPRRSPQEESAKRQQQFKARPQVPSRDTGRTMEEARNRREREYAAQKAARSETQRQAELKRSAARAVQLGGGAMGRRSPSQAFAAGEAARGTAEKAPELQGKVSIKAGVKKLGKIDLATAIIYSEILGKPVAMRQC